MTKLSTRQRECAELQQRGLCNKRIARALGISPRTVQEHLRLAYRAGVPIRFAAMAGRRSA